MKPPACKVNISRRNSQLCTKEVTLGQQRRRRINERTLVLACLNAGNSQEANSVSRVVHSLNMVGDRTLSQDTPLVPRLHWRAFITQPRSKFMVIPHEDNWKQVVFLDTCSTINPSAHTCPKYYVYLDGLSNHTSSSCIESRRGLDLLLPLHCSSLWMKDARYFQND